MFRLSDKRDCSDKGVKVMKGSGTKICILVVLILGFADIGFTQDLSTELNNRTNRLIASFKSQLQSDFEIRNAAAEKLKSDGKALEKLFSNYKEFSGECPETLIQKISRRLN